MAFLARISGRLSWLVAALIALLCVLLLTAPPAGLSGQQALSAAVILGAIGLWATGLVPEALTALLFFTVAMLTGIAPAEVIFAGLMSAALWLVFAGIVIGQAIRATGLGDRVAALMGRHFGLTYRGAVLGVACLGLGLAFFMPSSMGRTLLLLPIFMAFAERLGHQPHSRGWNGLVLIGCFSTFLPSFSILPANIPNIVLSGAAESLLGFSPTYGGYLLANFPVLGLLKAALLIGLVLWLYRGEAGQPAEIEAGGKLTGPEKRLALILAAAVGFWVTDFLHHISPAWIALAAACLCLLPPVRILQPRSLGAMNLEPVLYVGGIIGLGHLVAYSGIGELLGQAMTSLLPLGPGQPLQNFLSLSGLSTLVGLVTTLPGIPAVVTPLTPALSEASGLPLSTVLVTQVVGFSTLILPYQGPPLIAAMQISGIPRLHWVRLCLLMALLTFLVIWPLDYLWLRLLGIF